MWTSEVWEKNRSSENRSIKTANLAHLNLALSWMRRQFWASNTAGIFRSLPVIFWPCCIPECQLRELWVFLARQHNNFHSPYGPLIRFAFCNFLHSPKITMKLKGSSFGTLDQIQWPSQTQIKWTAALQKNKQKQPTVQEVHKKMALNRTTNFNLICYKNSLIIPLNFKFVLLET